MNQRGIEPGPPSTTVSAMTQGRHLRSLCNRLAYCGNKMQRVGIKHGSAIAAKGKKDYQSYGK